MKIFFEKIYYKSLENLLKKTAEIQIYLEMLAKIKDREYSDKFFKKSLQGAYEQTGDNIEFVIECIKNEIIGIAENNGKKI